MSKTIPTVADDVPGCLGLLPTDPGLVALLRFDEREHAPVDALGTLTAISAAPAMPATTDGYTGPARRFDGTEGLIAKDGTARALLPRTVSVMALVRWNAGATDGPDTLIAHGLGGSLTEHRSWHLRIAKIAAGTGRLEWVWQDREGVDHVQPGGEFFVAASGCMLLSATREWAGDRFLLRYWAGETLIGEAESIDLEVGGGIGSHVTIGVRSDGDSEHFHGLIDQLAIFSIPLTQEYVSWIWRRLAHWQPGFYEAARALMPPGKARTRDRGSLLQRLLRARASVLGTVAADVELRARAGLPDRAFGTRLTVWERVTGQIAKPSDAIETRQQRVIAAIRRERGMARDAVRETLAPLIGTDTESIELIEPSNITEGLDTDAWLFDGDGTFEIDGDNDAITLSVAPGAEFSTVAGELRYRAAALDGCVLEAELAPVSITENTRTFIGLWSQHGESVGMPITVLTGQVANMPPGSPFESFYMLPIRLRLYCDANQVWLALNGSEPVTLGTCPTPLAWAGIAIQPFDADRPTKTHGATWRNLKVYNPASTAPLYGYVYSPTIRDLEGARAQLEAQTPAHVFTEVLTNRVLVCDDLATGCDQGPLA